jgi:hypothetical protein
MLMLENDQSSDPFEIIELYRELGKFEKSLDLLKSAMDQKHFFIQLSHELINAGISRPVKYSYIF